MYDFLEDTVSINFSLGKQIGTGLDPDMFFVDEIKASCTVSDDEFNDVEVAAFEIYRVNIQATIQNEQKLMPEKYSLLDVMDSHSQLLLNYYEFLFEGNALNDRKTKLLSLLNVCLPEKRNLISEPPDLFIVSQFDIIEEYRNKNIELLGIKWAMHYFKRPNDLVLTELFPIKYESYLHYLMGDDINPIHTEQDKRSLDGPNQFKEFWKDYALTRLPGDSNFYVIRPACRLPY
jgi:hypothetical protein